MNLKFLKARLAAEPDETQPEQKYIFLVKSQEIAMNLMIAGFAAAPIGNGEISVRDFQEMIESLEPGKTNAIRYLFALAMSKKINDEIREFLKSEGLYTCDAWQIFFKKDYLQNAENVDELKEAVLSFIGKREYKTKDAPGLPEQVMSRLTYKTEFDRNGNAKSAKLLQTVKNFETVLQMDKRFAGKIRFDEFSRQVTLFGSVPWEENKNYRPWGSSDDSAAFSLIQADYGLTNRNDFYDGIRNVANQNSFHPLREMLDDLKWDGKEYVKNLLVDYLGCEPCEYNYQVLKLFMLGAVARIYEPGCKFDYTMILQGSQGIGKSTFLRLLALNDNWFNDSLDSLDSDKAVQSLLGSWVIELAELKSLARTAGGVESVKRFLSATQDKFREPYQRRADIYQRQCVFAGTTNKSDYLQDETGNRRFLIIEVGRSKPTKSLFQPSVMTDIKAAWSQAVHIWKNEHPALVLPESCRETAKQMQDGATSDDGKRGLIEAYLENKNRVCAIEIWQEALNEAGRPQKWQATELNDIVMATGEWKKMSNPYKTVKYGSQRGFQRTTNTTIEKNKSEEFMQISDEELKNVPFL